jgi:cytochrome c5
MSLKIVASLIGLVSLAAMGRAHAASRPVAPPKVGPNSIGGTVASPAGPEAGVWVIAETFDRPTRFVKVVVTDDQGRFVLPDLPKAKYKVWSRGYGLSDSHAVEVTPGKTLSLKASAAASASQAAQIYPANYWTSLIQVPAANEFPGTGPSGNGISPSLKTQQHWIAHMMENCQFCHQLGNQATRVAPDIGNPVDAWAQRIQKSRLPDDQFFEGSKVYRRRNYGETMSNYMTMFGRERGLGMFADWSTRIAKGEVPAQAPARPDGIERNVVITMQDMGDGRFIHDSSSTDKRNPTVNANGPIYGYGTYSGMVMSLDPKTGKQEEFKLRDAKGDWFINAHAHTGTMDAKGRVWVSDMVHYGGGNSETVGANPAYCTDPSNKFANYFPRKASHARAASVFDPKTKRDALLPVCFGTHHLNFDKNERLYFSGETEVMGWIDVKVWDKTKDVAQAIGWCPLVLDTNGDGKITPDRTQWNQSLQGIVGGEGSTNFLNEDAAKSAALDPKKDTRIAGMNYGMGVSPKDQSYWSAKYSPYVPSGIVRVETGANPPQTCKTEYYEPPKVNGQYRAYNIRGVDIDTNGIAWVGFGAGAIGRFDRSKCKVMNGPTAIGQQCPEGWEIIDTPGPKLKGTNTGTDWFYLVFVDHYNTFGLGADVPIFPNSAGDELLAYLPKEKKFVHLRVPYPMGFYARLVDGRIDNDKAGWKGRGLWATNNLTPIWHQETGEGSTEYAAHFQMRPSPLEE